MVIPAEAKSTDAMAISKKRECVTWTVAMHDEYNVHLSCI